MIPLKLSTASQEVPLGHFVDDADGKTAKTGLTIANTDIQVWKAGATTLSNKNSGGATHISGGIYYAVLDATDTNTLGPLVIFVAVSGALAVRLECNVYPAQVYDSLFAGSDTLQIDVAQFGNSDLTSSSGIPEVKVASLAANAITASAIAADAITDAKVASDVTIASVTGSVGSVTARVTANTDQIAGSATGATNLSKTIGAIGRGTVTTGATTTSLPTSAFSPAGAVADQFKGRVVLFDADTTTTALRGQAATISASSNAATPTFTVAALTTAPASGDTFSVV